MRASDVVIVGGGLIGLSLAQALGRSGLAVIVLDRDDPATALAAGFDGRASAIALASSRLLETIVVWPGVARDAEAIREIRVSDGPSLLHLHFDHTELGAEPFGYMVENRWLRRALLAAVQGTPTIRLLAPVGIARSAGSGGRARVWLDDGREVRADLIIACDGAGSALRAAAGIRTLRWSYPQTAIVCTVAHAEPHEGIAHERFLPSGPFAILPLPGRRSSIVWTETAALAPAIVKLDRPEFDAELGARFGDFLGALESIGPRWSYPLALHHAERYTAPRLVLVGDAAHGVHPIAGQGLNMGLRDVAALAEVLIEARRLGRDLGAPDVLECYQRWRRFDNSVLIAVTDTLNRLFSNEITPVRVARDLGLAAVNRLPPLRRFFMRHARGTAGQLPRLLSGQPP
ncbi:MAG: FAD-dependent oxidoreductase [Alphaproteobacteria bacterium]|nr:FAD-dependent oxidoreductase [Alphaproteobacteria bacterium]